MRQQYKRLATATLQIMAAAGLTVSFLAGGIASAQDKEAVVGLAVAKSGMFQPYDEEGIGMATLFIEQLNERGGLLGHKLKPIVVDTKSDRVEGAKAGQAVLDEGAKLVVVTCDYDFGAPAALQANNAGVLAVSLCAGDPKMGPVGVGPYAFSAGMAAQSEGATLANWAIKQKGSASLLADGDGHVFDERLHKLPQDQELPKKYASCFFGTDLLSRLVSAGVDTLIIAGTSTSGCVRATAVDAVQNGIRPMVVREAVGDRSPTAHDQTLFDLETRYADIVSLEETLAYLNKK